MKKINFVNKYEKKKMPKDKIFFYTVLIVCVAAVAVTSYIATYDNNQIKEPKSQSAKEVLSSTGDKKEEIKHQDEVKVPEVIINNEIENPEAEEDEIVITPEVETDLSNETKIPRVAEIEVPKMPIEGNIIKAHSVNTPVYSVTMNDWRIHEGIDISCDIGDEVYASASGKIVDIYNDNALGYTVLIEHNGYASKYSNLSSVEGLYVGATVNQSEKIGIVGDSASYEIADEAHLHFEILKEGKSVDPLSYIK